MKFVNLKEFRPIKFADPLKEVINYLYVDMPVMLRDLQHGLTRLTFGDNFNSFEEEVVSLGIDKEIAIRNKLKEQNNYIIPSKFIVVRIKRDGVSPTGMPMIIDGDTTWTTDYVYLKNVGTSSASFTVLFLR